MITSLGFVLAVILLLISALHMYWVCGGHWGANAVIPAAFENDSDSVERPLFRPGPLATIAVAVLLLMAALISLHAAGILRIIAADRLVRVAIWIIAGAFLLRGVGDFKYMGITKRVRNTRFAQMDSLLFTPLCLLLALLAFSIAIYST
ncbi:MAG: DUF3995 domain-containing protein [Verrucomicrobiales bacterium]|nr:DUF3995 domain-containing protein [Verrucomicrobiales bacterium]